jgi:hypothetical protein
MPVIPGHPIMQTADPSSPAAAPPPVTAPPPRRRSRRLLWLALAFVALLLASPLIAYFAFTWMSARSLADELARTDRLDPRWRLDEILADRKPVPDDRNSAVVVGKINALLGGGGYDLAAQKEWELFEDMSPERQLNIPQEEALRVALARHGKPLALARTLKDYPEGRFAIVYSRDYISTNVDAAQRCRTVMAMLQHDAMLRAHDEDPAGAVQSCRAALNAARALDDEPCLVVCLVRMAGEAITVSALERALAQGRPPEAELRAMQGLLAKEGASDFFLQGVRGERAGLHQLISTMKSGKTNIAAMLGGGPAGRRWQDELLRFFPAILTSGEAEVLAMLTDLVENAKRPVEDQDEVARAVTERAKESRAILPRLLVPAIEKVTEAHRRSRAQLRCAEVGVAAERFRLKHDRWPNGIAELVKDGLLKAVPADPYDGQPLRWRRGKAGVAVYSIGLDRVDNGGNILPNITQPGADIGFRVWDVAARRQPAPPPRPQRADDLPNP